MPVTDIQTDIPNRTLTIVSQFEAPVERIWQLWADPRQLELWWGPPTYPATVTKHDLTVGGRVVYHMTGPEGDQHGGWWDVKAVEAPRRLEFSDGFGDLEGNPDESMPVSSAIVELTARDGGTRMTMTSTYESAEALQKVLDMGVVEGSTSAINQIDALLAA